MMVGIGKSRTNREFVDMKICLSCGCPTVMSHRSNADCLNALSIEIPRLKRRLHELEAAKQLVQADGLCRECGIALRESDVESGECVEHRYARK